MGTIHWEDMNEVDVVAMASSGNDSAADYLLEKYKPLVRSVARPMFLVDGDQDDLVQEGMIGLFKAIHGYKNNREAAFKTYASLCIKNQIISAIKKSQRKKNIPLNSYISIDDENFEEMNEQLSVQNPEDIVIDQEDEKMQERKLKARLSSMECEVLSLFLQGLTYQEIALKMNKTPKAIDNALTRIKSKVSKIQNN